MAGHEAHVVGRHELSRDDKVTLVLAVLVVDHDHELARFEFGDGLRDCGQAHLLDEVYRRRFRAT